MTDLDRGVSPAADEDRLPWLEAVEDEQDDGGVSTGKLIGAVLVALIAIGLVVGGIFWIKDRSSPEGSPGEGELIAAPAGDYKEKPTEPGGMKVEGQGDAAYAASEGSDVQSTLDLTALPETPLAGPGSNAPVKTVPVPASTAAAQPAAKPAPAPVKVAAAEPKPAPKPVEEPAPAPVAGGGTIQLGAFSSESKANAAWTSLSGRFGFLAPLAKQVIPVTTGTGSTLYRLRANGAGASGVCQKLKVAGESCTVVG